MWDIFPNIPVLVTLGLFLDRVKYVKVPVISQSLLDLIEINHSLVSRCGHGDIYFLLPLRPMV